MGEHKEWGTLVFNYSRHEVRNFLVSNALFWFDKYHIDGIQWMLSPCFTWTIVVSQENGFNQYGGRENLEAADFLRQANQVIFLPWYSFDSGRVYRLANGVLAYMGIGLYLKWNMGWMCWITSAWIPSSASSTEQHHV